jgi:hypothetical protein
MIMMIETKVMMIMILIMIANKMFKIIVMIMNNYVE